MSSNCYKCGKSGHFARECYSSKSGGSSSLHSGLVKCYDCHEMVADLKSHRFVCNKSKFSKAHITGEVVHKDQKKYSKEYTQNIGIKENHQDVYFLMDTSGSMLGSRIEQSKRSLELMITDMDPLDRMAVITFDSEAFFKLKPRPIEEIKRKNELPDLLNRIKVGGSTAIYDAITMAVTQLRDKSQKTLIIVLTDGQDNSSKTTYEKTLSLISEYPNITLNIVEVDGNTGYYKNLCSASKNGKHVPSVSTVEIVTKVTMIFKQYYSTK